MKYPRPMYINDDFNYWRLLTHDWTTISFEQHS